LSESNQRPTDYKSVALPAELKWQFLHKFWPPYTYQAGSLFLFTAHKQTGLEQMNTNKELPRFLGRQR